MHYVFNNKRALKKDNYADMFSLFIGKINFSE